MPLHVYRELYVHLVWHTQSNAPVLIGETRKRVYQFFRDRCRSDADLYFHGIGGTANHVHLAVSYEPNRSVSDIVKDLKGASARDINKRGGGKILEWQRGYGAVSFGARNLRTVLEYIGNQEQRHALKRVHDRLERVNRDADEEPGSGEAG